MSCITDAQRYFHFDTFSLDRTFADVLRHEKMDYDVEAHHANAVIEARAQLELANARIHRWNSAIAHLNAQNPRDHFAISVAHAERRAAEEIYQLIAGNIAKELTKYHRVSTIVPQYPLQIQPSGDGQAGGGRAGGRREGDRGNGGEAGLQFGGAENKGLRLSGGGFASARAGWSHKSTRSDIGESVNGEEPDDDSSKFNAQRS